MNFIPWPFEKKQTKQKLFWTLFLIGLNIFIFISFNLPFAKNSFDGQSIKASQIETTGFYYRRFIAGSEDQFLPPWLTKNLDALESQYPTLGHLALKDQRFLKEAENMQFSQNPVQGEQWKQMIKDYKKSYLSSDGFFFGLSQLPQSRSWLTWITYQFSHSNWEHLLSNMAILFIVGAALETTVSGGMILLIYVLSGLMGGALFLWQQGYSVTPMVGASASVSGLLAYLWLAQTRKNIPFFYFFSPVKGHYGIIYLPALMLVPLFLIGDFSAQLSRPEGLAGGVAYMAHIGGTCAGLIIGFIQRFNFSGLYHGRADS